MFFELPWVGVAKDAMAVAISIKYLVCQNRYITFYLPTYIRTGTYIHKTLLKMMTKRITVYNKIHVTM